MKKFFFSILIFFGVIFLIVAIFIGYIFLRYQRWEKEFESNIKSEYLINGEDVKKIDFVKKISTFALSMSDTQFLELEVKEVGSIFFTVLDSYMGDSTSLERMYIEPKDSQWIVYSKIRYEDISVWISVDLNKDNIQSAQVYVKNISIGPFPVSEYTNWIEMINKGIAESIVTLNENGLVGRYIENIELLEDSIVLKGSRY